jgi:hypothetical protein
MIYKVSRENESQLIKLPETGMGFQFISARYTTGYERHFLLVLNCSIIIELDKETTLEKIEIPEYKDLLTGLQVKKLLDIRVGKEEESFLVAEEAARYRNRNKGAIDNPVELVTKDAYFIRLSAYHDDKRIDKQNKRLLPGSYTTTLEDYLLSKANKCDFIERYAIPNPARVKWAFEIMPKTGIDSCQIGTTQPNFGLEGGGEECYFAKGTSFGSFVSEAKSYNEINTFNIAETIHKIPRKNPRERYGVSIGKGFFEKWRYPPKT